MTLHAEYPATRYEPSAVRAFFRIIARWGVRDEDARVLLGGMSNGPNYEVKKNPDRVLDTEWDHHLLFRRGRPPDFARIRFAFRTLYSASNSLALSTSRCCLRFVPPPKRTMNGDGRDEHALCAESAVR